MMKAVLVAVDGSEGSRQAAAFARGLAVKFGAHLTVIHVVEPLPESAASAAGLAPDELRTRQLREGQRLLDEICSDLDLREAETVLEIGRAAEAICAEAEDRKVDMIVVGAYGHGPYRRMAGSVGSRLVDMASRTVTVVR